MTNANDSFRAAETALFGQHNFPAQERMLDLRTPPMRARVLEAGEGPPTLYVHGGGGFGALWVPLAAALPGRRHVLVDRPGCGLSDYAPIGDSLRTHAVGFLDNVLDALELPRVDIVANSMGGLWSLFFAVERPERVRSLALVGAPSLLGGSSAPLPMRLLGKPGIGRLMMRLEPPSPRQVRTLWGRMGHDPDRELPAMLDAMLHVQRTKHYARAWRELLGRALTWSGARPGVPLGDDELPKLKCPVTYVWGATDPFCDASFGRAIAERTPGARFAVVGEGHFPWLDDATGVAREVEPVLTSTPREAGVEVRAS